MDDFSILDKNGFTIKCIKNKVTIYGQKYPKKIGYFNEKGDYLRRHVKKGLHFMRTMNGYGICYEVVRMMDKSRKICIQDEYGIYVIPASFFWKHKKFLKFDKKKKRKEGFELQVFLNIDFYDVINLKGKIIKEGLWRKFDNKPKSKVKLEKEEKKPVQLTFF